MLSPSNPVLPFCSNQIGGKCLGAKIGWVFPIEEEEALRRVRLDIWDFDWSPTSLAETVELQIIFLVGHKIADSLVIDGGRGRAAGSR